jgi:hypothetical protein
VSDTFLPDAIARTIPIWSSTFVAVGIALHLRSMLRECRSAGRCLHRIVGA